VGSDRLGAVAVSPRRCSTALVFGIWYSNAVDSGRRGDDMSRMCIFVFLKARRLFVSEDDRAYWTDARAH
jgi:hypothetical protein